MERLLQLLKLTVLTIVARLLSCWQLLRDTLRMPGCSRRRERLMFTIRTMYTRTALMWAAFEGYPKIAKMLLEAGSNPNEQDYMGMTPLMDAISRGHNEIARMLLEAGANINLHNNLGWTALTIAASQGRTETARLLLEAGADFHIQENDNIDALMWAARGGFTDIMKMLIEAGADLNHALIKSSSKETDDLRNPTIRRLLKHGANIDAATDEHGRTALMMVRTDDIAEMLIEAWADIDLVDKMKKSALVYAGERGLIEAAFLMLRVSREHTDQEYKRFLLKME